MNNICVVKRNGERTPLDIGKIRNVAAWACEGLECYEISLEAGLTTRLRDGVTTREIQDNLISCALELCSPEEPDWRYVAGRLLMWGLWKDTKVLRGQNDDVCHAYLDYPKVVKDLVAKGLYASNILGLYTDDELEEAGKWINPDLDSDYDYAGGMLLTSRYLLPGELPQEAFLTIALLLAEPEMPSERLFWAKQFYLAIAHRKISLATPILANLRTTVGSLTSCFIVGMEDNLESIFSEITNTARISKSGGGVGVNCSRIRATGSKVMGKKNASGGVIPWIKILNDTAIAVNQGGKRAGAVTVSLDIWHLDVPEFLEMQTENGDQRRKAYDVFPQLVLPDLFMERVVSKESWTLVDPYEVKEKLGIELPKLWGKEFEEAYQLIENSLDTSIQLYHKVDARSLLKTIMKAQVETGLPYLAFKDTINRANPNKHDGYIPGVNLCVAPETKILTKLGYLPIGTLKDQSVEVWNGEQWSNTTVKQTGENQELIKVSFSNGVDIECTPYHHFYVKPGYKEELIRVEARELKPGDKLIKFDLPVIQGSDIDFPYAYTHGFFCGEGNYKRNNKEGKLCPIIQLYGVKKDLVHSLDIRNYHTRPGELAIYADPSKDAFLIRLPEDILAKFIVPTALHSLQSRLDWLAGLLDSDGSVKKTKFSSLLAISNTDLPFLQDVQLMLQTLGVEAHIYLSNKADFKLLPHSTIPEERYSHTKVCYKLSIPSTGSYQLSQLGLKTNRLNITTGRPNRSTPHFVSVKSVEYTGRVDDTYCFTEPLRNMGMFNGILAGQCVESFSNVTPGKTAHCCNLVSLNLANLEEIEMSTYSQIAVRLLDNTIDISDPPLEAAAEHNNRYRTIGVGAMGLADWLAKRRLSYSSLQEISDLFEDMGYWCTNSSMELAVERGSFTAFTGSEWDQGKLINSKPLEWFLANSSYPQRWEDLANCIQEYGIRNSHITAIAPNTSSSLVQGCTASILPCYSKFFYDKGGKGAVPIAPPNINTSFWFYQENKNTPQDQVVEAVATIQQWIDTGISMELVFNLNQGVYFPDEPERAIKAKDIFDTFVKAWRMGCKAIYYVRTIQKDDFKENANECSSCAN